VFGSIYLSSSSSSSLLKVEGVEGEYEFGEDLKYNK